MRMVLRRFSILIVLLAVVSGIVVFITRYSSGGIKLIQDQIVPAAPLVEPVMKDISAELGWQNTGILLESGETIHIQLVSGEIRDGDALIRGPSGVGWACDDSNCCEPMPDADRDALIGRVGDEFFLVGDKNGITVATGGELQLRINDCDAGLYDNSGSLRLKISP